MHVYVREKLKVSVDLFILMVEVILRTLISFYYRFRAITV